MRKVSLYKAACIIYSPHPYSAGSWCSVNQENGNVAGTVKLSHVTQHNTQDNIHNYGEYTTYNNNIKVWE